MDLPQFLDHVINLILPGLGTGAIAAALAKLFWRRDLADVSYLRLAAWAAAACAVVAVAGLVTFGRDGRMNTYLGMVGACAVTLMCVGWRRRSGT